MNESNMPDMTAEEEEAFRELSERLYREQAKDLATAECEMNRLLVKVGYGCTTKDTEFRLRELIRMFGADV